MAVTAAQFRENFPEFANTTAYPNAVVNFWLTFAYKLLNSCRWGDVLDEGAQFFVAHNLTLERQALDAAQRGNAPGVNTGPVTAKSVGPGSINYASAEACAPDAGHWNLTTYGTRFWWLANLMGMGPIQFGIGFAPMNTGIAWPGPAPWPLPSGTGFSS